jgi:chitodextrinase
MKTRLPVNRSILWVLIAALGLAPLSCGGGDSGQDSGADTQVPSAPSGLVATPVSTSQIDLTWEAATDNVGVTGYAIERNGAPVATAATTSFSDTGLNPDSTYCYRITARDAAGNESDPSSQTCGTTLSDGVDTQPPTVPGGLTATPVSANQIDLGWSPSSDNVGVTNYNVFRDGAQVFSTAEVSGSDSGLAAQTLYCYEVSATDAAGNESGRSSQQCATTLAQSETQYCLSVAQPSGAGPACNEDPQLNLLQAETKMFTADVVLTGQTSEAVTLSASIGGNPPGFQVAFQPETVTSGGSSVMTISTTDATPTGPVAVTVTGSGPSGTTNLAISVGVVSPLQFENTFDDVADLQIEPGGNSALVADCAFGPRLVRVDLASLRATRTVVSGIGRSGQAYCLTALDIEQAGTTALVGWGRRTFTEGEAKLLRADLATGAVDLVATGFNQPRSITIEAGETTALISDDKPGQTAQRLARLDLQTGQSTELLGDVQAQDLQIEAGGGSVVAIGGDIMGGVITRINLATGAQTTLANQSPAFGWRHLVLTDNGQFAVTAGLHRVDLASGQITLLVNGGFGGGSLLPEAVDEEADGNLVRLALPRIERFLVADSQTSLLASLAEYGPIALSADQTNAYVAGSSALLKVDISNGQQIASLPYSPMGDSYWKLVLEPGEATALALHLGTPGNLLRIDLATGAVTEVVGNLQCGSDLALEPSGTTALIVEDAANRLIRVDLTDGSFTVVASDFVPGDPPFGCSGMPASVSLEAGGASALVGGGGPLFRVDLATGAKTELYPGPTGAKISVLPGGTRLLVGNSDGLLLIDLSTGTRTVLGLQDALTDFLVEPGGASALLMSYSRTGIVRLVIP